MAFAKSRCDLHLPTHPSHVSSFFCQHNIYLGPHLAFEAVLPRGQRSQEGRWGSSRTPAPSPLAPVVCFLSCFSLRLEWIFLVSKVLFSSQAFLWLSSAGLLSLVLVLAVLWAFLSFLSVFLKFHFERCPVVVSSQTFPDCACRRYFDCE